MQMPKFEVKPEMIRSLYAEAYPAHLKCENCGVEEPMDDQFDCCSRCQSIPYCSRECQKKHWKIHKKQCREQSDDSSRNIAGALRRCNRFATVYGPMLTVACTMQFAMHNAKDSSISPSTHTMLVHVSDLPNDGKTRKPRLRVDKLIPLPLQELSEERRVQVEEGIAFHRTHGDKMSYFLVYRPEGASSDLLRPVLTSYQDSPFARMKNNCKTMSPAQLRKMSIAPLSWIQSINEMAKGQRPDLFEAMKRTPGLTKSKLDGYFDQGLKRA